ncbi:MAG: hypothetical protein AAB847_02060 [Patescibacteria group bacterium]
MKKIFGLLLLAFGSVALLAFGQVLTAEEQDAFNDFSELYGPFENIDDVGDWCAAGNFNTCMGFAKKRGLKDYDDTHEKMVEQYEEIYKQCGDDKSCYLGNVDEFVGSIKGINPELALEIERAGDFAQVTEIAGNEGVDVSGFGKVTEENFNKLIEYSVAQGEGVEGAFEAVQKAMIAQYSDKAIEYGFNPEEFAKYADQMADEMKLHFISEVGDILPNFAGENLYLGPPVFDDSGFEQFGNYNSGQGTDYKGWTEGSDDNWIGPNNETYTPGSEWTAGDSQTDPNTGATWTYSGDGTWTDSSGQSYDPASYQYPSEGTYTQPVNYTPSALLYILLHLLR